MARFGGWRIAAMAAVLTASFVAAGQEAKRDRSGGYTAILDNIDMLIDNYTRFLGRKYDLSEEQDQYTKQLLREKAYAFLDKREDEMRDLFDQLFEARSGGEMSAEQLMEWGKRVTPIYEEAKKIINEGNDEWRGILTDQQKAIHDQDLKLMNDSFATTEEQLNRIVSGEMTVDEFRSPQRFKKSPPRRTNPTPAQPPVEGGQAAVATTGDGTHVVDNPGRTSAERKMSRRNTRARPSATPADEGAQPPGGQPVEPATVAQHPGTESPVETPPQAADVTHAQPNPAEKARPASKNYETEWEKYVRDFIEKYKLNEEQTQQANSILKDCETQAEKHLAGRNTDLERIEEREKELKAPSADKDKEKAAERTKELGELAKQRDAIMEPIGKIFESLLKPRLEKLPTRAQRKAADEAAKKPAAPAKASSEKGKADKAKPAGKADDKKTDDKKP